MSIIQRKWSPQEADEWKKEDWIAIIFSVISYFMLTVGSALSFLLLAKGFIYLGIGIVATIIMYWVIDPKLKVISQEYEKKQKDYLKQLEDIQRWEASK